MGSISVNERQKLSLVYGASRQQDIVLHIQLLIMKYYLTRKMSAQCGSSRQHRFLEIMQIIKKWKSSGNNTICSRTDAHRNLRKDKGCLFLSQKLKEVCHQFIWKTNSSLPVVRPTIPCEHYLCEFFLFLFELQHKGFVKSEAVYWFVLTIRWRIVACNHWIVENSYCA